ncbi:hypothetical protein FEK35_23975 [Nocardia cyriacigeorgica]|uniref:Uncharacterized protein n=1 Tax=Nocardia cyriacigeorgica TaxID=135487 RepID=A0A5R8P8K2_9NOCA|nr:Rdx family protein [Nocardia cyriacigeorgica]TLG00306.1 hypothetical protein FEK35_23975 [Nocardia cyriacigeorgica]
MKQQDQRSITINFDGEQIKYTGDVELKKTAIGTFYVTMDGEVVWSQHVRNGVTEAVTFDLKGFPLDGVDEV